MTIKKNRGHTMRENIRTASAEHFDALWSGNTLKRRPRHYTLDFHTKVQVWGKSLSVSLQVLTIQRSILVSRRCQPWIARKKRKKEREKEKGRRKEWERTGNLHIKLHRVLVQHTQAAHARIQSRNCFASFSSLCCSTQHAIAAAIP